MVSDIALGNHDHIFGDAESSKTLVGFLSRPPSMDAVWHDYEYVEIAVWSMFPRAADPKRMIRSGRTASTIRRTNSDRSCSSGLVQSFEGSCVDIP